MVALNPSILLKLTIHLDVACSQMGAMLRMWNLMQFTSPETFIHHTNAIPWTYHRHRR